MSARYSLVYKIHTKNKGRQQYLNSVTEADSENKAAQVGENMMKKLMT